MMLGSKAVTEIVRLINNAKIKSSTDGITESDTKVIRAYKYEKGKKETGEYIAVNHLPFITKNEVQEGTVNINIHVPQQPSNEPNTKRLDKICDQVIALFPKDLFIDGAYYNYYCDSRPVPDNDKTYFVNLQIQVTFSNL